MDSSPVKPPPASDWLTELSDAEETLVNSASESEADTPQPAPTFFRSFIFSPEVPIRLDYQGKRVDMEQVKYCVACRTNILRERKSLSGASTLSLITCSRKSIDAHAGSHFLDGYSSSRFKNTARRLQLGPRDKLTNAVDK